MRRGIGLPVSLLGGVLALSAAGPALAQSPTMPKWLGGIADFETIFYGGLVIVVLAMVVVLISTIRSRRAVALLRDIFDAVPQPRQVVDRHGKTILANDAFRRAFPGADKPIPALLLAEVAGDEDAQAQIDRLAANARNGTAGYTELRVRPAENSGEQLVHEPAEWRHVAAYPVSGRPGAVLWLVDDITLRRQLEQVIQEEQNRFVDLLENAPIGFYSVDGEGRFLFANQTLCDWLGRSHESLESNVVHLHDVLAEPPPDGTLPYDPFGDDLASRGEVTLKDAAGRVFEVSINQDVAQGEDGRGVRTRSVVRHLSHERAMAEALERSVQRFERFFREAPVGIALLDVAGRFTEANRTFGALVGREPDSLTGSSLRDLVPAEQRGAVDVALGGAPGPVEVRFPGEVEKVCSMYVTGLADADGATAGFIAHFIDSTEQKNLELQFSQSQKMQAVGQLAGGIAHDFNNLLTAMIGFSDLLLLRHRPGDQSFADIMQIKQNAARAANLVRQLLAFSRQQSLQPRLLNVTDILAELSHLLRRLIGENIDLDMKHGRDLGTIKADQGQLEQVIINLVVNARDAMTNGGKLSIRTSNATVEHERKVRGGGEVMPPGDYVLIEVSDAGTGIASENMDRIFDPFFSTKEVGEGTGLGLSTVFGIVKQSSGFVFVDSTPGQGSTFSVYLPYQTGTVESTGAAETEVRRDLTGNGTILLVEDEEAVRAFSARVLRNKGYDVLEANSGDSALEVFRERAEDIDLVVTDVVMPHMDGPTLVRHLREERQDLKIIFISGYTEDAFRKRLGEESGIHFLPKPFSLKQLAAKVKDVLSAPGAGSPASPSTKPEPSQAAGPAPTV
ncbi:MAG: response regulator [Alphaproteobacteria bacterium]